VPGAFESGAGEMNRTPDLLITNELLYRLSYTGFSSYEPSIIAGAKMRLWAGELARFLR
jgi:hypothetical protein